MQWKKYLAVVLAASMTVAVPVAAQAQESTGITVETTESGSSVPDTTGQETSGQAGTTTEPVGEQDAGEDTTGEATESAPKAKDAKGVYTELSETTRQLLDAGSAQIVDGWLILTSTGEKIDPVSGIPFTAEELAALEHQTENPGEGESGQETDPQAEQKPGETAEEDSAKEAENADEKAVSAEQSDTKTTEDNSAAETESTTPMPNPSKPIYEQGVSISESSDEETSVEAGTIVPSPVLKEEFRFWTVAKEPAIAKKKLPIREEMKSNSRTIGILPEDGICYILSEEADGWVYVESGSVRGFVRAQLLHMGEEASVYVTLNEAAAEILSGLAGSQVDESEIMPEAEEKIPASENEAFAYLRATVYQSVVEKDPAVANREVIIREAQDPKSREIGTLKAGGLCYVIADRNAEWVYVESGDVRGFVPSEDLVFSDTELNKDGKTLKDQVEERGESTYAVASEKIPAKENAALYYTKTSIHSGAPGMAQREEILSYAAQFIGNPYVWGGTDPVNGADCSGYVQTIYKQFGYTLPRTAAEQAQVGEKIPVEDAQPGDLIFYGKGSGIYHVVIYAGDGKTLEAKGREYGIVSDTVSQKNAVWAVRVVDDSKALSYDIPEGLGKIHTYMGWQKVTNVNSQQYAFRETAGMTFDPEGFAVVDNRYVIACTDTFGQIGDYIDFYQKDGTKIPCIIGDLKNQNDIGCNEWGHMNGECIVEFVVDQNTWYGIGHANPGTASCHPEWSQEIVRAEKIGSFYGSL